MSKIAIVSNRFYKFMKTITLNMSREAGTQTKRAQSSYRKCSSGEQDGHLSSTCTPTPISMRSTSNFEGPQSNEWSDLPDSIAAPTLVDARVMLVSFLLRHLM